MHSKVEAQMREGAALQRELSGKPLCGPLAIVLANVVDVADC